MNWWQAILECDPRVFSCLDMFINARDHRGLSNLHFACESGHPTLVSAFLKAGIDVNDSFPIPPLIYAAKTGRCDIVRILLSANARIPIAWNLKNIPAGPRAMLRAIRATRKWKRWSRRRRRSRERQWAYIVWYTKRVSCDKQMLLGFL